MCVYLRTGSRSKLQWFCDRQINTSVLIVHSGWDNTNIHLLTGILSCKRKKHYMRFSFVGIVLTCFRMVDGKRNRHKEWERNVLTDYRLQMLEWIIAKCTRMHYTYILLQTNFICKHCKKKMYKNRNIISCWWQKQFIWYGRISVQCAIWNCKTIIFFIAFSLKRVLKSVSKRRGKFWNLNKLYTGIQFIV